MSKPVLEVIACSVADAIAAQKGGANRLEIVRDLDAGGLTPALDLVRRIKDAVSLPLRVMLRESNGYDVKTAAELNALCDAAASFASVGVDGLVLGFLNKGKVDLELTARLISCAPNVKVTFHHAFEDTLDQTEAVAAIRELSQVDRILSSGGAGDLSVRIERLSKYQRAARPKIEIIAGGGIDGNAIRLIGSTTGIREFHVGRAARRQFRVDGEVSAVLVSDLIRVVNSL